MRALVPRQGVPPAIRFGGDAQVAARVHSLDLRTAEENYDGGTNSAAPDRRIR
jgi:hypothetical protein